MSDLHDHGYDHPDWDPFWRNDESQLPVDREDHIPLGAEVKTEDGVGPVCWSGPTRKGRGWRIGVRLPRYEDLQFFDEHDVSPIKHHNISGVGCG